jgi:hypothetical protein
MLFLAAWMMIAPCLADEAESDPGFTEQEQQERMELRELLERKPAVIGAATAEPSERPEMYLDYSETPAEPGTAPSEDSDQR